MPGAFTAKQAIPLSGPPFRRQRQANAIILDADRSTILDRGAFHDFYPWNGGPSVQTWEQNIMSLLDFPSVRRYVARLSHTIRKASRAAPLRSALQLERLEDRLVLDTVTFAQFIHIGESPQVFAYTNNGGTSADFNTLPGGDPILLSFDPRFAPGLATPRNAHLFLTSHTTAPTIPPLPFDNLTREHFPAAANTIQIVLDTPVDGERNFLTVT